MSATTVSYDLPGIRAKLQAKMGESAIGDMDFFPERLAQLFPHILTKVTELWGSAMLDTYLDNLMIDDRGSRQGFPPDVAMEIFHLISQHGALGLERTTSGSGWGAIDDPDLDKG